VRVQKIFLIFSLALVIVSCRTVTNYEKIVNTGYKEVKTYNNYTAQNNIELMEKKDKVYFNDLPEDEKKEIFPEYPEKPGAVKKFLYNFIKIDFEKEPVYYKLENDIFKKDDYVFFFVKDARELENRKYLYLSVKNRSKNWFHMGAIDFKTSDDLVRINFETKKLSGDSFWLDRTRVNLNTEEYIAFILEDNQINDLIKLLKSGNKIEIVLYSDYSNTKRTRDLTEKEREDMLKMYDFYEDELESTE
jgi:hypothetical protein